MSYLDKGLEIIKRIEGLGYSAYLIGGVVRDYLLKEEIHDIDIATNMPLDQIKQYYAIKENGIDYASITIENDGYFFEVTHFRRDVSYLDHRHPMVELTDTLLEDIQRRDFTINALAMDSSMKIIDYSEGYSDLNNKIIRMIGNPILRFEEDALRILRALYFSSKLGFQIEQNTLDAMVFHKKLLAFLSHDRIFEYFKKILYTKNLNGINYIKEYDLFEYIEEYKNWLGIVNKNCNSKDLCIYYYLEYGQYPMIAKAEDKRNCLIVRDIIDHDFSNYSLFRYQKEISNFFEVFSNLGYDIIEIEKKLKELRIKSDKELDLSKKDISKLFQGKMISIAIEEVIKAILDGRIDNNKRSIIIFLQGLDVLEC